MPAFGGYKFDIRAGNRVLTERFSADGEGKRKRERTIALPPSGKSCFNGAEPFRGSEYRSHRRIHFRSSAPREQDMTLAAVSRVKLQLHVERGETTHHPLAPRSQQAAFDILLSAQLRSYFSAACVGKSRRGGGEGGGGGGGPRGGRQRVTLVFHVDHLLPTV